MGARSKILLPDIKVKLSQVGLGRRAGIVFHQHQHGLGGHGMRPHRRVLVLEVTKMRQGVELAVDDGQRESAFAVKGGWGGVFFAAKINWAIESGVEPGQCSRTEPDESRRRIVGASGRELISKRVHDNVVSDVTRHHLRVGVEHEPGHKRAAIACFSDDRFVEGGASHLVIHEDYRARSSDLVCAESVGHSNHLKLFRWIARDTRSPTLRIG